METTDFPSELRKPRCAGWVFVLILIWMAPPPFVHLASGANSWAQDEFAIATWIDPCRIVPARAATTAEVRNDLLRWLRARDAGFNILSGNQNVGHTKGTPEECAYALGLAAQVGLKYMVHDDGFRYNQLVPGDYDGDGRWEMGVYCPLGSGDFYVRFQDADGHFRETVTTLFDPEIGNTQVVGGDFNGDGLWDVGAFNTNGTHQLFVFLGYGDGTFHRRPSWTWNIDPTIAQIFSGDYDHDGLWDIGACIPDGTGFQVMVWFGLGDGTFGDPSTNHWTVAEPAKAQVFSGDFDGDGFWDIGRFGSGAFSVRLGSGGGAFRPAEISFLWPQQYPIEASPFAGDFDGDGRSEIGVFEGFADSGASGGSALRVRTVDLQGQMGSIRDISWPLVKRATDYYRALPAPLRGAMYGYFVKDEPDDDIKEDNNQPSTIVDYDRTATYFRDVVRKWQQRDSERPAFINLNPNYKAFPAGVNYDLYTNLYLNASYGDGVARAFAFDHYPFSGSLITPNYFENLAVIRQKAAGRPFWAFVKSIGSSAADPSESRLWGMALMPIAYGAKGLAYFTYEQPNGFEGQDAIINNCDEDPTGKAKYQAVARLNKYITRVLGPVAMRSVYRGSYHTGSPQWGNNVSSYLLNNATPVVGGVLNNGLPSGQAVVGIFTNNSNSNDNFVLVNNALLDAPLENVELVLRGAYPEISLAPSLKGYNGATLYQRASTRTVGGNTVVSIGRLEAGEGRLVRTFGVRPPFSGDFNGDGITDIGVFDLYGGGEIYIWYGDGSGGFAGQTVSQWDIWTIATSIFTGDFNGDGLSDIGAFNPNLNQATFIRFGLGDGTFASPRPSFTWNIDPTNAQIFTGDFNGDGFWDIGVYNQNGDSAFHIWFGLGNGSFGSQSSFSWELSPQRTKVTTGDFNGDGLWDIAAFSPNGNQEIFVRFGLGDGSFAPHLPSFTLNTDPASTQLLSGDFDGDGFWDVGASVPNGSTPLNLFYGNGAARFPRQTSFPWSPGEAQVAGKSQPDHDGDGLIDFIDPDADDDGLSNFDEIWAYRSNPLDRDSDHDGWEDGAEAIAGTSLTDPADFLRLRIARDLMVPSQINLTWKTVSGRTYRLMGSDDLIGWSEKALLPGDDAEHSRSFPAAGAGFYRLEVSKSVP